MSGRAFSIDENKLAPAVRVQCLNRVLAGKRVLDQLDLTIEPGEFVALLGRSGSGKSTLLRALGLPEKTDLESGRVAVHRDAGFIFQDARLLPWLSIEHNVRLGLSGPEIRGRACDLLAEVGLAGRQQAWPNVLSGGEAQRVAIARALIRRPGLLLADEPFGALDALTRAMMQQMFLRLVRSHHLAVLFVTHDIDEALLMADRVLVLDSGRLSLCERIATKQPRDMAEPHIASLRFALLNALGVTS